MTARSRQPMSPLTLESFTDEQLQAELDKRKAKATVPAPLATPDFNRLIELVTAYIKECAAGENVEDDKQWIYEAAIEGVYGPSCWEWFNDLPGNR